MLHEIWKKDDLLKLDWIIYYLNYKYEEVQGFKYLETKESED